MHSMVLLYELYDRFQKISINMVMSYINHFPNLGLMFNKYVVTCYIAIKK